MSSPIIHRPIPRRPFELALASPTPPDADSPPPSPRQRPVEASLLDPQAFNRPVDSSSRAASYRVLTSSTLSGIYSDDTPDAVADEDDYSSATPVARLLDESLYKLVQERSSISRRRSSALSGRSSQSVQPVSPIFLGLRTGLLFFLGMGYGALLSRLSTADQKWAAAFPVEGIIKPGSATDSRYLAAWGVCGVVLGSLLPWFDGKWEQIFKPKDDDADDECEEVIQDDEEAGTDWALVVRGIGAFVGIVFAIVSCHTASAFFTLDCIVYSQLAQRKVPWASTMQVSLTLAVVNPFLWYMIDRSKPGFLLSAAVGLAGSLVLMGLNTEIMPTPTGYSSASLHRNVTDAVGKESLMLGGLATQKTIENGIWALSVLFCSCMCFGNIGRRLALNRSAAGRGRWGGLK